MNDAATLIAAAKHTPRLHLGCGENLLTGWVNIDERRAPGVTTWDLRQKLPLSEASVDFIFAEHFIEHVDLSHGVAVLAQCRALLRRGGVLRLSTPDLRWLVARYLANDTSEWIDVGWAPQSPCRMLNEGLRLWRHKFVYDQNELETQLRGVGFETVDIVAWRESQHAELSCLECRPYHKEIIVEATA